MKKLPFSRRFNLPIVAFLMLLLLGVGLAWWIQSQRFESRQRIDELKLDAMTVRYDLVRLSDSLRAALLDPKNPASKLPDTAAKSDLERVLGDIEKNYGDVSTAGELMNSMRNIRKFGSERLETYRTNLINLQGSDSSAAIALYAQSYAPILSERDQALTAFSNQIDSTEKGEDNEVKNRMRWGIVGIIVIAIFTLAVGIYQTSSVTQPLGELVDSLERMRRGDFTRRLDMQRHDEFGVLADGLNRLADDLSVLVGQVQRSGIQVNSTATEIAATARQQQSTANEIAATTAHTGATSKQISATSRELVKTMSEVNDVAEETGHLAGSGLSAITGMETTLRQIMDAAGSINSKLTVLNEKTGNINSVVTTITKVADQTNLLSLNAAIEAEKAGEYGVGFAVVAMEIRRLADQTAVATYDIEKMVKEMQSAVSAGVMGMDKFSDELRQGVEEIRQVSTQLAQIIHQVQALTPRFQTVNEGMQSQTTGAQQISDTLTQLSDAAHQTAESLRQSNHAIEQLNSAARSLQNSVTRFKLESLNMMFLLFHLGKDRYVLEARHVIEVLPLVELKKIPESPRGVAGMFSYRGRPVPAIDLNELTLGHGSAQCLSTRIIIINYPDESGKLHPLGLIAERATEIIRREASEFTQPGLKFGDTPYLGPVLMDNTGVIQWVYDQRLLTDKVRDVLFCETAEVVS